MWKVGVNCEKSKITHLGRTENTGPTSHLVQESLSLDYSSSYNVYFNEYLDY